MAQERGEYPRPQCFRHSWLSLNGEWEFEFDDERVGDREAWYERPNKNTFSRKIQVPFAYQSKLSGIGDTGFHDLVWYRKSTKLPKSFADKKIILHFGAVDYASQVWVNGHLVASHEGGHTPFQANITHALEPDVNWIVVRAEDFSKDTTLPRGKQYWEEQSRGIFYTRTTGIWQTVWLEAVSDVYLDDVRFTPDIDRNEIGIEMHVSGLPDQKKTCRLTLRVHITFKGEHVSTDEFLVSAPKESRKIKLHDYNDHSLGRWWSPERPNLYDVQFELVQDGEVVDRVDSYFGMRKISIEQGRLCLNNRPYTMRLVLDQGYFPEGILTPPSGEALKKDVELAKEMGFNGARKHQKVEDPRYLYWCDKLGFLVWGEMANAYDYSNQYVRRITQEWQDVIQRDYSHPSLVVWVPLNESWGVPNILIDKEQQQHALMMYHLTKSLDSTRPVVSNDGWEMVKTDLCTIHDYEWRQDVLMDRYRTAERAIGAARGRNLYVGGHAYDGEPILVTEFGGIAFKKSDWEGWGYSGAENDSDFLQRLTAVFRPMHQSPTVQGFCYTQLTDVEQEINGLLTYDRKPKVELTQIRRIVTGEGME